jgi:hypothetical protein
MALAASSQLALKRGALVTAANWPVIVLQFVADTIFTALLAVPVVGGVALVVLTSGLAPGELMAQGVRRAIPAVAAALLAHPIALAAFLVAVGVALLGGSLVAAFVKGGTITILATAEAEAPPIEQPPLRFEMVRQASRFRLETATAGAHRLFARFARLGVGLVAIYLLVAALALGVVVSYGAPGSAWAAARIAALTAGLIAVITVVNLVYLLLQIVVAVEDCDVTTAVRHLGGFLARRPWEIALVFGAVSALVALGTAASFIATTALGLIAFVPLLGLAALPLQLGAWMVRGLVFQFLGLTALVAYVWLYRAAGPGGAGGR